jgi:hypothetical protein
MHKNKTILVLVLVTVFMFILAPAIFLISIKLDDRIGEYDRYSVLGFLALLVFWLLSFVSGCITLKVWLSQRKIIVEDLSIYKDCFDNNEH